MPPTSTLALACSLLALSLPQVLRNKVLSARLIGSRVCSSHRGREASISIRNGNALARFGGKFGLWGGLPSRRKATISSAVRKADTICAIATGEGAEGAVGIVRMSGPQALNFTRKAFRTMKGKQWGVDDRLPKSHRVYYGKVVGDDESVLDEVLLLPMLSPRSYTREDVIEFHCHGGRICLSRVLSRCLELGCRLANPGEFTLRAYLNGRIDLAQAESISQLISAKTVAAADSALAGLGGGIGERVGTVRKELIDLMAEVEARVDFEEDVEDEVNVEETVSRLKSILGEIRELLATVRKGKLLREGFQLALVGRPNVGKSSLLNRWCGADKAIVTDIAGTTRDVVEASVDIGGFPVTLLDTAGIRAGEDVGEVEKIGVERSRLAARDADIIVMVTDASHGWLPEDDQVFQAVKGQGVAVLVANKVDTTQGDNLHEIPTDVLKSFSAVLSTSARTGEGMDSLEDTIARIVAGGQSVPGGKSWAINQRQAEALMRSNEALERLIDMIEGGCSLEMWGVDLKGAVAALGEVKGDDVQEEMLDEIFSRFCIGK